MRPQRRFASGCGRWSVVVGHQVIGRRGR